MGVTRCARDLDAEIKDCSHLTAVFGFGVPGIRNKDL